MGGMWALRRGGGGITTQMVSGPSPLTDVKRPSPMDMERRAAGVVFGSN